MAHPPIVPVDDPQVERVRARALLLPDAEEKVSHGCPAFCTTKVFAYVGAHERVDGELQVRPHAISVLLDDDERRAVLGEGDAVGAFAPAYLGPSGWVSLDLERIDDLRLGELLDASYRRTASATRIRRLDER